MVGVWVRDPGKDSTQEVDAKVRRRRRVFAGEGARRRRRVVAVVGACQRGVLVPPFLSESNAALMAL